MWGLYGDGDDDDDDHYNHMLFNCYDYDVVNTCCQLIFHPYTTWIQLF